MPPGPERTLARRLGLVDAVFVGLGAMVGAGLFSAFAPAARAAGSALLIGLALAAVVALCNATASAQLAAQYPASGGTYVYGRERLGAWWGFAAGWSFVIGKTASCAAMALTFATYAVPDDGPLRRILAAAAVVVLAGVNLRGVTRTVAVTRVLVVTVLALVVVVLVAIGVGVGDVGADAGRLLPRSADAYGVLQAAGLLFFAFAGYARVATLGEEVRDPARTIPRAVVTALAVTVALYAVVAVTVLLALGPLGLAASGAPLADAAEVVGAGGLGVGRLGVVVRVAATLASLGALLALVAGVARTALAMARRGDLPRPLAAVHPRYRVPHVAEVALAVVVTVLVLTVDLRAVIGFSSFGVLLYYAVANLAAFTQPASHRRWPRSMQVLGAAGCVALAATVPWPSLVVGVGVLAVGFLGRAVALRRRSRPAGRAGPPR